MNETALFTEIYKEFKDRVYTISYRYLGNRENALDVSQDIFVKLFETQDKLPPAHERGAWIYRITVNRCIDFLRKRKPMASEAELANLEAPRTETVEGRDEVDALLAPLNPDQRLAVILKEIIGLSVEETGRYTNTDAGTVKSRLSRARDTMRDALLKRRNHEP